MPGSNVAINLNLGDTRDMADLNSINNIKSTTIHLATCPTAVTVADASTSVCTGSSVSTGTWQNAILTANPDANPNPDAQINYSSVTPVGGVTDPNGQFPSGNHSGADNCVAEIQSISAYLYCDEDQSSTRNAGDTYTLLSTFNATVYPDIQAPTIVTNGCVTTVTGACSNDIVTLSNQTIATGVITNNGTNSVTYTAQLNDAAGMVDIDITSGIAGSTCTYTTSSTATPLCGPCPTAVTVTDASTSVCTGTSVSTGTWQNAILTTNPDANPNPDAQINYSSVTPVGGVTDPNGQFPSGNHSGADNCVAEIQSISAYLYCDEDQSSTRNAGDTYTLLSTFNATVYPDIQAPTIVTNACVTTVTGACSNDIVTLSNQTVATGVITNNGTNSVTYTAQLNDAAGMVDIDITSGIAGSTCTYTTSSTATPLCGPCPTAVTVTDASTSVCTGSSVSTGTWQNAILTANPDANPNPDAQINYSSVTPVGGVTDPNGQFPSGNHSGADNCVAEIQSISAYLYCDEDQSSTRNAGDTYTLLSTFNATVYPDIQAPTIVTNGCVTTITGACSNDIVTLSNQTVATGVITNNGTNSVTYTRPT